MQQVVNYDELGKERKRLQLEGRLPSWFSTASWQIFKSRYLYQAEDAKEQYQRIARTAALYLPESIREEGYNNFFNMLWDGVLSASTPVLGNTGTNRGLTVSCQGSDFGDSLYEFFKTRLELAIHSQKAFGTSGWMGDVRPRGSSISTGTKAEGVVPLMKGMVSDMQYVSQGGLRRGQFAGYIPLMHGDFDEVVDELNNFPEDFNVGFCVYDKDIEKLTPDENKADPELNRRFKKVMAKLKMPKGKGYWMFPDKANRCTTEAIKRSGKKIKASNLC